MANEQEMNEIERVTPQWEGKKILFFSSSIFLFVSERHMLSIYQVSME